jgi:hypothetical protein
MLVEKLIEQHRVYLVVADAVRFAFLVANDQVWIDYCDLLRHEPQLLRTSPINLFFVAEGYRFEPVERCARFLHWVDVFLKAPG